MIHFHPSKINQQIKSLALDSAKTKLKENFYDLYHTLTHHEQVLGNCRQIVEQEGLEVDMDILEIACYWHDVFKGKGENEKQLLKTALSETGLNEEDVNKVVKIIEEHSFGKVQTLEESKVLYDADKIELVSIPRWKYVFDEYDKGNVSLEERDRYINEWNRRMPLLENHLHYSSSNLIFRNRLKEFKAWLKSIDKLDENGDFILEIDSK